MAKGVNYYDGSSFKEVAAVQDDQGNERSVFRWDGSQWVEIFPSLPVAASNLVAWYEMEQDVTDSATNSNFGDSTAYDGTDNTSEGYTQDSIGSGSYVKDFDGTDDRVDIPITMTDYSTGFSVSVWVYPTDKYRQGIVSSSDGSNQFDFQLESDGEISWFIYNGSTGFGVSGIPSYSTNTWTHLVATYDDSNGYELFKNGSSLATETDTTLPSVSQNQAIGSRRGPNDRNFYGSIEDVRLYNKALSSSEASDIYNNTQ